MFAGASPVEVDYKRQLRAEQWARFCGRHSCSEIIEKCSRSRLLEKDKLPQSSSDSSTVTEEKFSVKVRARANSAIQTTSKVSTTIVTTNSKANNESGTSIMSSNTHSFHSSHVAFHSFTGFFSLFILFVGIRSKLSKVFNFVSRDKSNQLNMNNNSIDKKKNSTNGGGGAGGSGAGAGGVGKDTQRDFIVFGNATSLHKNGHMMMSRSDGYLNKSLMRPLEVPKLEVTSPHNQELIRKYEKRYSLGNTDPTKPPALPPRRNSKIMF